MAIWFGAFALVAAAAIMGIGIAIYPHDMGPHAIATIAGILGEAALVVLVLDRITRAQERRDWAIARRTAGELMAASAVDVMRLCGVRWSRQAYGAHIDRYEEFVRIADIHFADLRSNLQALVVGVSPDENHDARRIEMRIAWLLEHLRPRPTTASRPAYDLEVVAATATLVHQFVSRDPELLGAIQAARKVAEDVAVDPKRDAEAFWSARMRLQTDLLAGGNLARGIWFDMEGELAVKYFALDAVLLGVIGPVENHAITA
jgi:hypothetical protein